MDALVSASKKIGKIVGSIKDMAIGTAARQTAEGASQTNKSSLELAQIALSSMKM
jgi:hypothetical protein